MNESLKDDNRALLTQLDKFTKRIKSLEGEALREQDSHKSKDIVISDLNKQITFLTSSLEDAKLDSQQSRRETDLVRSEVDAEIRRHRESKDLLKSCEEKCTQLY